MTGTNSAPTFGGLRRAARAVKVAEHGRQVVGTLRPRGVMGVFRSRGPLTVILWVAFREGRLVWRGDDSFALLVPPLSVGEGALSGGVRLSLLRLLDQRWETIMFAGPSVGMLLGAVACIPLGLWALAIAFALLAMMYVSLLMAAFVVHRLVGLISRLIHGPRRVDHLAAESLPSVQWSMSLCHQVDAEAADHLMYQVSQRLTRLIGARVQAASRLHGGRASEVDVLETLVCQVTGVTTIAMREALQRLPGLVHPYGASTDVVLVEPRDRDQEQSRRSFNTASFFFWYVAGGATVLALVAKIVAILERQACGTQCRGHPATYFEAVRWLAQRLLLTDPAGLHPAAAGTWAMGWLTSLLGLMTVPVAAVAVRQQWAHYERVNSGFKIAVAKIMSRTRILVLVATLDERDAVLSVVRESYDATPRMEVRRPHVVFRLGQFAETEVVLNQCISGPYAPEGLMLAAADLIRQYQPHYVILTGTCFGLKEQEQCIGDIVVVRQVRDTDHRKVTEVDGVLDEQPRGHYGPPSVELLNVFAAASASWTGPRVHIGPMLSSGTLVNSKTLRDRLKREHPDALAGDMESHVLYSAASKQKVDWIAVRGISDWGMEKERQEHRRIEAARNAASYIFKVIDDHLLDGGPAPAR